MKESGPKIRRPCLHVPEGGLYLKQPLEQCVIVQNLNLCLLREVKKSHNYNFCY
jgi:hypothetical protein